jgi:hypothetical protein
VIDRKRLRAALHVDEVNPGDLVELLNWHFGGARHVRAREIAFPIGGEPLITLRFSKDDRRCEDATAGPGLDATTVAEIEAKIVAELVESSGRSVGTTVIFSSPEQVTGFWRYEDRLQLRPVPTSAARPPVAYADHPLVMDFTYRASADVMMNAQRQQIAARRWTHRLNLLVVPGFKILENTRWHWAIVPQADGSLSTAFVQEGYSVDGLTFDQKALAEPSCDPMERVEPNQYYGRYGTSLEPVKLPTSLERSVALIEVLPVDVLVRFDHATYWFNYATNLAEGYSVRAIALGSTVEALFEPEASPARCPTCGNELRGPTARFIDFMSEHLPGPDAVAARRLFGEFYGLRSRPAHGHVMDHDFFPTVPFMPGAIGEGDKMRALFSFVRIALVNWLSRSEAPVPAGTMA